MTVGVSVAFKRKLCIATRTRRRKVSIGELGEYPGGTYLAGPAILGAAQNPNRVLTIFFFQVVMLRLDTSASRQTHICIYGVSRLRVLSTHS
jgi:hypothetical protein